MSEISNIIKELPNYTIKQEESSSYYQITNNDGYLFIIQVKDIPKYIEQIKTIHDNHSIIVDFLKLNGFIKHKNYYYLSYKNDDICVHICLTNYKIIRKHKEYYCTFDEFFTKIKEMLDLEYSNKPIINMY